MSRSTQARALGQHLSKLTGVRAELRYDAGSMWLVEWADGPTRDEMRDLVDKTITSHPHHFGLMAGRTIRSSRHESTRAWAARAVAARRDGALAREVSRGVAARRALGVDEIRLGTLKPKAPEWYVLLDFVQRMIDSTSR
ncbi:hypothetical protein ACFZDG_35455 [Kitasatospora xanthocidica]|uniref:hypothetical protein n=1 Tax=Kitasatospora xanthocidica TaxID=83382 RepID=UPI0036E60536